MEREQSNFAPSRRRLGALLAAGAAMALPAVPAFAAQGVPDADLIAFGDRVVRLSNRADRAWLIASQREDAAMLAKPDHPMIGPPVPGMEPYKDMPAAKHRQYIAEALAEPMMAEDDPWIVERRARLARMEAHEAECTRLEQHFRTEQAAAVAKRSENRLQGAAGQLAAMRARTLAGVRAKASAALAGDALEDNAEWATELAISTLRDVLKIGGAA